MTYLIASEGFHFYLRFKEDFLATDVFSLTINIKDTCTVSVL